MRVLILIVTLAISTSVFSQVPGYVGKKYSVGLVLDKNLFDFLNETEDFLKRDYTLGFRAAACVGQNGRFHFEYTRLKSTQNITVSSPSDNYQESWGDTWVRTNAANQTLFGNRFSLGYRHYFGIAPLGLFYNIEYSSTFANRLQVSDDLSFYRSDLITNGISSGQMGVGKSWIIAEMLQLDFGLNVSIHWGKGADFHAFLNDGWYSDVSVYDEEFYNNFYKDYSYQRAGVTDKLDEAATNDIENERFFDVRPFTADVLLERYSVNFQIGLTYVF